MTTQAIITCVILVITMVLLISQKVPLVILGAAIPAALAATGVINAGSAYTEFGNTTIVFFMGLVVVGEAFFKTGLADFIGGKIIGLLGKTEKGLLLGTGLVAGGLSAFLNDTGSTACLMPIVSSMASKAGVKKSKLLMALAFFASLGGTITLVGTTPHIVANGILKDMACGSSASSSTPRSACPCWCAAYCTCASAAQSCCRIRTLRSRAVTARQSTTPKRWFWSL